MHLGRPDVSKESLIQKAGQDLWRQLKRVSVLVFNGDNRNYENWRLAFNACVDQVLVIPEYKLLQLRKNVSGEAPKSIKNLGHSGFA